MKILFVQKRPLFPALSGGKIRTLNVIRHLAKWHEITYVCNVLQGELELLPAMRELGLQLHTIPWAEACSPSPKFIAGLAANLFSRYPYTVNKDFDSQLRSTAIRLLDSEPFDLLVCDFVQTARNVLGVNSVPKLLFQHNVEALTYQRMADNEPNRFKRWFIRLQQRKMERFERDAGCEFDRVIAVSQDDREYFCHRYDWQSVDVIDTAVDTTYFQPTGQTREANKLVFVGSLDWLPNQQGIMRFVRESLPILREARSEIQLDIVGKNPPQAIRQLEREVGVQVYGNVNDVRPYMAAASVAIIPLHAGGGTRLKFYEFMAMGTPVVGTTLSAEGLPIVPNKHWLRADSDRDLAKATLRLLDDSALRQKLSTTAREYVLRNFSAEVVARQFEQICQATATAANREI